MFDVIGRLCFLKIYGGALHDNRVKLSSSKKWEKPEARTPQRAAKTIS